jgi:hypothetical protein
MQEVDFSIVNEDWSRYIVNDGTVIRVRIMVRKILRTAEVNPQGYPNFSIESMNVVSALVPDRLKGEPSKEPWNPKVDRGEETKFDTMEEKWQIYHTHDGFKISVRPVVTKIFSYNKYNELREPIYNLNIQQILNVDIIRLE